MRRQASQVTPSGRPPASSSTSAGSASCSLIEAFTALWAISQGFRKDLSFVSTPAAKYFLKAVVAILTKTFALLPPTKYTDGSVAESTVAVFYDKFQDHQIIEELLLMLSEQKIASATFQLDADQTNLTQILETKIKATIRYNVILAEPQNVILVLRQALGAKVLQINYYWTVIDSGIQPSVIEDLIPANESANILIVREPAVQLSNADCNNVLDDCQTALHQRFKIKTIEALFSLAVAMQNLTDSVGQSALASNASCQPPSSWTGGSAIVSQMRQQRQSMNSEIGWLPSGYFLESFATFHDQFYDPVKFVPTGRFYIENSSLVVTFLYRKRLLVFPNTFIDFKNKTLRVCSVVTEPYTTFSNGTFGTPSGFTVELFNYLGMHLNFTYTMFSPPDNQFGAPTAGSPYFSGCIGMLQKGEADASFPFATTSLRSKVIDYSESLMDSANTVLVKRPTSESKLWNVYTPLSWDSWALIFVMIFIAPLIVYIFARLSPFTGWTLRLPYAFADEIWLKEYVWSAVGSFLQQGQDFYPFAMSPRVVMAFWWILTVILFASYTGDLTSKLAVTISKFPIQSIEELVSKPYYTAMVPQGTNIYSAVLGAKDGPLAELRKQWTLVDSFDQCATYLVTKPDPYLVCISTLPIGMYYANIFCKDIYKSENNFNQYVVSMALPKDSYNLPAFDFLIQSGKANGVLGIMIDKFIPQTTDCGSSASEASEADSIPLEGVGGAYVLSLALYGCGLLILLLELLWVRLLGKEPLDFPGF